MVVDMINSLMILNARHLIQDYLNNTTILQMVLNYHLDLKMIVFADFDMFQVRRFCYYEYQNHRNLKHTLYQDRLLCHRHQWLLLKLFKCMYMKCFSDKYIYTKLQTNILQFNMNINRQIFFIDGD